MKFITAGEHDFKKYKDSLLALYVNAFTSGKSFQYNNAEETLAYLKSIFQVGYGVFALKNKDLAGAILVTPLSFDKLVPSEITSHFDVKRSVYIAEMMVEKSQQGQGIGKELLNYFWKTVDSKQYYNAFIRVWIENEAAMALYKKFGFEVFASVVQAKLLADKSAMFDFKKVYMHKKLR